MIIHMCFVMFKGDIFTANPVDLPPSYTKEYSKNSPRDSEIQNLNALKERG